MSILHPRDSVIENVDKMIHCINRKTIRAFAWKLFLFEDTVPAFNEVLEHSGKNIDLISCPYQTSCLGDRYRSFHLKELPICIACLKNHRLAQKAVLTLEDLYGETLILSAERWGGVHPLLVTLPVEWNYRLPYGLIDTKDPSKEVRQLIFLSLAVIVPHWR